MSENAFLPSAPVLHETAGTAAASQAKALVEARYTVALARPRDLDVVRAALLKECKRQGFAETAEYAKPMGKKKDQDGKWVEQFVYGPSIRFAEAAIRCMSNIVVQEITLYDDEEKRIVQVSVCDLEANLAYDSSITVEKTVERRSKKDGDVILRERTTSNGDKVYIRMASDDEILNKKNALLSKSIRNMSLRLIPGDLVDECMRQVLATQRDTNTKDPDAARKKIMDAFAELNVSVADLKAYVGTDLATISPAQIGELRALHSAIKEGETTWKAAMETRAPDGAAPANPQQGAVGKTTEATKETVKEAKPPATRTTESPKAMTARATMVVEGRELVKAVDALQKDQGMPILTRLCGVHGSPSLQAVPDTKIESIRKDLIELTKAQSMDELFDKLGTWENAQAQGN